MSRVLEAPLPPAGTAGDSTGKRPAAGHFCRVFLRETEMYIYQQLGALTRYEPVVLTRRTANEERFPWSPVFASDPQLSSGARGVAWAAHRARVLTTWERLYFSGVAQARNVRVLHAHHGQDGRYAVPLVRRLGVPLVTSFYGWDSSQLPQAFAGLGRRFLQPVFRVSSLVLALSEYMASELVRLGCPPEKVRVQRVGVDVESAEFVPRTAPPPGEPVRLVSSGRFIEKKGFPVLLHALALVRRSTPDVALTLVGDGPERPQLEALVDRLGLRACVTLTGFLPHAEVQRLFRNSHVLVQPSVTARSGDKEGIPGVLMEGMATGLPAVSTYHAGIPELVRDGVSGRLVPERDAEALASAIADVVSSPDRWPRWGVEGRRRVDREHNLRVQSERLEAFYDDLVARWTTVGRRSAGTVSP